MNEQEILDAVRFVKENRHNKEVARLVGSAEHFLGLIRQGEYGKAADMVRRLCTTERRQKMIPLSEEVTAGRDNFRDKLSALGLIVDLLAETS